MAKKKTKKETASVEEVVVPVEETTVEETVTETEDTRTREQKARDTFYALLKNK